MTLTLPDTLKLLADPTRLRLLALLAQEELAVQELVAITGLAQSRISNHLALLRRAGLVRDRRDGSWSFHSLVPPAAGTALSPELHAAVLEPYLASDATRADRQALAALRERRRERSRRAHDQLAERWAEVGSDFTHGSLRAEALAALAPRDLVVADLGCGTGYLSAFLAERVRRVIAIDHAPNMLESARQRLDGADVELRQGELENLPLGDGEVDAAFANLVWHHVADFDAAARELYRSLRPGGVAVITDLLPHDCEWMREALGDLRLGLSPDAVVGALARAGFTALARLELVDRYRPPAPSPGHGDGPELPMFLVRGERPRAAD